MLGSQDRKPNLIICARGSVWPFVHEAVSQYRRKRQCLTIPIEEAVSYHVSKRRRLGIRIRSQILSFVKEAVSWLAQENASKHQCKRQRLAIPIEEAVFYHLSKRRCLEIKIVETYHLWKRQCLAISERGLVWPRKPSSECQIATWIVNCRDTISHWERLKKRRKLGQRNNCTDKKCSPFKMSSHTKDCVFSSRMIHWKGTARESKLYLKNILF